MHIRDMTIIRLIRFTMILVIRSDLFYSIGAPRVTKIITPSDPTRETDHLDHDSSDHESNKPIM